MNFKTAARLHHAIALQNPCEFAEQCSDARYFFGINPCVGLFAGVGMTVNVGQE